MVTRVSISWVRVSWVSIGQLGLVGLGLVGFWLGLEYGIIRYGPRFFRVESRMNRRNYKKKNGQFV